MRALPLTIALSCGLLWAAQQTTDEELAAKAVEAERRGDFARAVSAFQALLRQGSDGPELRSNLGIAYFQLREFRNALIHFRVALAKDPGSVPANLFSGLSLLQLQLPKKAVPYLENAHRANPQDVSTILALASARIASNDLRQAKAEYEQATRLSPQSAEGWYGLGITQRALAENELKISRRARATTRDAAAKTRGLMESSERAMTKAMQLDPASVRAHMIFGESFRIAERYDEAVREYKAATEQRPDFAPAWAGLATAFSAAGNDHEALQAAGHALKLEPADADTNALIAATYLRQSDYAKARPYAIRALQLNPQLAHAQTVLAKIYLAEKQPEKALPQLQAAIREDTDGQTHYLLATTLRQLGRPAESAAAMRRYKELHSQALGISK